MGMRDVGCQQHPGALEAATRAWHGAGLSFAAGQRGWGATERRERVFPSPSLCSCQPPSCERCPGLWFGLAASRGAFGCGCVGEGLGWELETWMLFSVLAPVLCGLQQISAQL